MQKWRQVGTGVEKAVVAWLVGGFSLFILEALIATLAGMNPVLVALPVNLAVCAVAATPCVVVAAAVVAALVPPAWVTSWARVVGGLAVAVTALVALLAQPFAL